MTKPRKYFRPSDWNGRIKQNAVMVIADAHTRARRYHREKAHNSAAQESDRIDGMWTLLNAISPGMVDGIEDAVVLELSLRAKGER